MSSPCSGNPTPSTSLARLVLVPLDSLAPLPPITVSEPLSVLPALDPTSALLMAQLQDACPSVKKILTSPSLKVVSVPVQDFHLL